METSIPDTSDRIVIEIPLGSIGLMGVSGVWKKIDIVIIDVNSALIGWRWSSVMFTADSDASTPILGNHAGHAYCGHYEISMLGLTLSLWDFAQKPRSIRGGRVVIQYNKVGQIAQGKWRTKTKQAVDAGQLIIRIENHQGDETH
jgi:hypothetical protein